MKRLANLDNSDLTEKRKVVALEKLLDGVANTKFHLNMALIY